MSMTSRFEKHERLFRRMADRNGADLDLAVMVGAVTEGEVHDATLACTACTSPGCCEALLDDGVTGIPSFCRNKDMIRDLAELMNSA